MTAKDEIVKHLRKFNLPIDAEILVVDAVVKAGKESAFESQYISFSPDSVCLDGDFTITDLLAIIDILTILKKYLSDAIPPSDLVSSL